MRNFVTLNLRGPTTDPAHVTWAQRGISSLSRDNFISSLLFILLLSSHRWERTDAIQWLAINNEKVQVWNKTGDCTRQRTPGFLKEHRRVCQSNLELMPFVVQAAKDTVEVCQELFADRRWNCSSILLAPNFVPDLTGGSREQSFVYSLSAAALAQSIAKGCSAGHSSKCNCGQTPTEPPPGQFKWGGCGDDVRFGVIFSKWFTDAAINKKKMTKNALMNMHNNAVGRKILADSLTPVCKCHGVSGSCSVKTCFKSLPGVRVVGVVLQGRYSSAVEVSNSVKTGKKGAGSRRSLTKRLSDDEHLIYYTISPDYCLPDQSLGSIGTRGRECEKDNPGSAGCRSMCCGRGFTTETVEQKYRCDCRYYWCCYVKCKICTKSVQVHRCR